MTMHNNAEQRFEHWHDLFEKNAVKELVASLKEAPIVEVTEFLSQQTLNKCMELFQKFDHNKQADIFCHFSTEKQSDIYYILEEENFAKLFEQMPSDLRADFYLKLEQRDQVKFLPYLSKEVRKDVITLSEYPSSKAGGIMDTDFIAVPTNVTVEMVFQEIRKKASEKTMTYCIYIIDETKRLIGIVDLKSLVVAPPQEKITNLASQTLIYANLYDDQEQVAHKIEKYNLHTLPVLDDAERLVGIINYDDAIHIIRKEEKEDMEKFMGIVPSETCDTYMDTSSQKHFLQRIGWIVGLFCLGIVISITMHSYEAIIHCFPFLSFYLMTISDTGGNVGSQTASTLVRSFSLGEISTKHWAKILWKEIKIAIMIAMTLFPLCLAKVYFVNWLFQNQNTPSPSYIGLIVGIAVMLQVTFSILIGTLLPLFIKKIGKDPALAASPAITTLVDITGIFVYLLVAQTLLPQATT